VIGGDHGYSGAVRMAAEAAARCGAGLVSVATRKAHAATINTGRPELMCQGVETIAELLPLLEKAGVVAIGPGLGQSEWSVQMLSRVGECRLPTVMDADALNLLAREPAPAEQRIITPHPGEAARLLGCTTADIQADRYAAIEALQKSFGGIAVLKGSGTLVADGEGRISVHSGGNPGMASGGMGDVLTGVIAALLAQGSDPAMAARLGVSLHARAADRAAGVDGERGLLAGDLFPHLRKLLNSRS
jgi:NAD(P)H-hydrate epimerase